MCNASSSFSSLLQLAPAVKPHYQYIKQKKIWQLKILTFSTELWVTSPKFKQVEKQFQNWNFNLLTIWILPSPKSQYKILDRNIDIPLPVYDALAWIQLGHEAWVVASYLPAALSIYGVSSEPCPLMISVSWELIYLQLLVHAFAFWNRLVLPPLLSSVEFWLSIGGFARVYNLWRFCWMK